MQVDSTNIVRNSVSPGSSYMYMPSTLLYMLLLLKEQIWCAIEMMQFFHKPPFLVDLIYGRLLFSMYFLWTKFKTNLLPIVFTSKFVFIMNPKSRVKLLIKIHPPPSQSTHFITPINYNRGLHNNPIIK